jgi:YoeB-like toxin of bacterial type II toxin-antitoxin system
MSRGIAFTSPAWADYLYWQRQYKKTLKRINLKLVTTVFGWVADSHLGGFASPKRNRSDTECPEHWPLAATNRFLISSK